MYPRNLVTGAAISAALALAPVSAMADNPVFGSAKHKTLAPTVMKKIVGQGATADYWGRSGRTALANADYFAYYGVVYNSYSNENYYYWNAYVWANKAANRLYNAWYYAGY